MEGAVRLLPLALTAVALLAACGGDGNGGGSADGGAETGGALVATLTDTECSYDGPTTAPPGRVSVAVTNEVSAPGRFELLRVVEGAIAEDLVAYVEGERLSIGDGQEPAWPPVIATVVQQTPVAAGASGTLAGRVQAGTYGIVCWVAPPPTTLHLAATFRVG